MPENSKEGSDHVNGLHKELLRGGEGLAKGVEEGEMRPWFTVAKLQEIDRNENGEEAFENIENEADDAGAFAKNAKDIGGADIAGAVLTDVDPFDHFADDEPERGGGDDEGDDGKGVGHGERIATGWQRKRRGFAPPLKKMD